jgi:HNH endonuclease
VTTINGDLESSSGDCRKGRRKFTVVERIEIGERDDWLCGICRDPVRLVEKPPVILVKEISIEDLIVEDVLPGEDWPELTEHRPRRPLSASIDHIMPLEAGGSDDGDNLQLAHLFCNLHKNDSRPGSGFIRPEYVRAVLANLIDGTPVPELVHRGCFPSWAYPAPRNVECMIALLIAAGDVGADPRYGDPTLRTNQFIRGFGSERWLETVADMKRRRTKWRTRWGVK